MASYSGSMRNLGIVHIVFGILLLIFGIAEVQVTSKANIFLRYFLSKGDTYYFGIWIGIWMFVTGIVGIVASRSGGSCLTGIFMFFSIVSCLFGVTIIVAYGTYLSLIWIVAVLFPLPVAIAGIIIVLGVIEFIIGLWAAIYCCVACFDEPPLIEQAGQQVPYKDNPGFASVQGAEGVTVAVPMQGGGQGGTVTRPFTPGAHEYQPQKIPMHSIRRAQIHPAEAVDTVVGGSGDLWPFESI